MGQQDDEERSRLRAAARGGRARLPRHLAASRRGAGLRSRAGDCPATTPRAAWSPTRPPGTRSTRAARRAALAAGKRGVLPALGSGDGLEFLRATAGVRSGRRRTASSSRAPASRCAGVRRASSSSSPGSASTSAGRASDAAAGCFDRALPRFAGALPLGLGTTFQIRALRSRGPLGRAHGRRRDRARVRALVRGRGGAVHEGGVHDGHRARSAVFVGLAGRPRALGCIVRRPQRLRRRASKSAHETAARILEEARKKPRPSARRRRLQAKDLAHPGQGGVASRRRASSGARSARSRSASRRRRRPSTARSRPSTRATARSSKREDGVKEREREHRGAPQRKYEQLVDGVRRKLEETAGLTRDEARAHAHRADGRRGASTRPPSTSARSRGGARGGRPHGEEDRLDRHRAPGRRVRRRAHGVGRAPARATT